MTNEIDRLLGSGGSVIYPGMDSPGAGEPATERPAARSRPPAADPAQPPEAPAESEVPDGEPDPAADPQSRRYQRWRTVSALAALGATALFVVLALVLALVLPRPPHRAQPAAPGDEPVPSGAPDAGARVSPEASAASPSVNASVSAPAAAVTGEPSPTRVGAGNPVAFQPVSYEAEAPGNVLSGSAVIQAYPGASGGTVVTVLSAPRSDAAPGTLTFTAVEVPATGPYTLVVSYVYVAPFSGTTGGLVITVDGSAPVTTPLPPGAPQGTACCATVPVPVTLRAGVDSINFGNPSGVAVAIDRIVVTR